MTVTGKHDTLDVSPKKQSSLLTNENNDQSEPMSNDSWGSNTAFLFASIGAAIGLGNIVRFPFLAFRHGGAAFLIPYILALLFVGVPILGLEFMLGQRMRAHGAIRSLGLVHARAWGVGSVAVFTAVLIILTYNVVMAWSWVFLFNSFKADLPWGTDLPQASAFFTQTVQGIDSSYQACGIMKGGDDTCGLGGLQWQLVLGLGVQYVLLFLALSKGKHLVGKVVMWTMPLPFFMLLVILCYGFSLDGHAQGITAYIGKLDVSKLNKGDPWVDAIAQIFFGMSLAVGGMIAYGSGLPSDSKVVKNTWIVALSNSIFSFFSGFAMFMVIGFLAHNQGRTVESYDSALGGYSLAFKTFPVALNLLPSGTAQFFCVLFFAMLVLLGFDSAMNLVESVVAALKDASPACERNEGRCVGAVCLGGFVVGLMFCTKGGEVVLDIIDHFSSTYCMLLVGVLECIVVGWVYDLVPIDDESAAIMEGPSAEQKANAGTPTGNSGLPTTSVTADINAGPGSAATINPRVPPLLDSSLSAFDRIRYGVFSSRLQREIAHMTGQDPRYLPFAWAVLVKFFAPAVIFGLMVYNIKKDAEGSYGGYPAWTNTVFGWVFCLMVPMLMLAASLTMPMKPAAEDEAAKPTVAGATALVGHENVSMP
jgi:NSS family neurotransmitter:Na+ symporter